MAQRDPEDERSSADDAAKFKLVYPGGSLLDALDFWTDRQPDKVVYTHVDDNGAELTKITYQELRHQSNFLAAHLITAQTSGGCGLSAGDRALLVYPYGIDFIVAFYACLRANIIAVPVFPPDPRRGGKDVAMFAVIQSTCGADVALTNRAYNFAKKVAGIKSLFLSADKPWPTLRWIPTDAVIEQAGKQAGGTSNPAAVSVAIQPPASSQPAFLQFTSGSTSAPKGVIITHGNLAHNLNIIIENLKADSSTTVVSWLPLYHDMGLIGSWLGAMYCGGSGVYHSPFSFIKNPVLWVNLIHKHRGTHMQAPNFAYGLVARKFLEARPRPFLDLSCVRHMINAAEPVRSVDMQRFYAAFEASNLRRDVIFPTYGLAEHTVFVCSNGRQVLQVDRQVLEQEGRVVQVDSSHVGAGSHLTVVGCGFPAQAQGVEVAIVPTCTSSEVQAGSSSSSSSNSSNETDTVVREELGEGFVGEVWVRSPSRAAGYWGNEAKSREDFGGEIQIPRADKQTSDQASDQDDEFVQVSLSDSMGFLRTGDLGFMLNGELFITGRRKDLIIVRGRNIYPQDLERSAEDAFPELRKGCSAAFSVPLNRRAPKQDYGHSGRHASSTGPDEAVVLIAELSDTVAVSDIEAPALMERMRAAVAQQEGVPLQAVCLLRPRTIPKTTSGKIARQWCRRAFLESSLDVVAEWYDFTTGMDPPLDPEGKEVGKQLAKPAEGDAVDDMSDDEILEIICHTVAVRVLKQVSSDLEVDAPIPSLGLGSMEGVQVMTLLEKRFGLSIPHEIMFEEETTLRSLVPLIRGGGRTAMRSSLIDGAALACNDVPKQTENERQARLMRVVTKSSWKTGMHTSGCLSLGSKLSKTDEELARKLLAMAHLLPSMPTFIRAASTMVLLAMRPSFSFLVVAFALVSVASVGIQHLVQNRLQIYATKHKGWRACVLAYFSVRVLIEQPLLNERETYLIVDCTDLRHQGAAATGDEKSAGVDPSAQTPPAKQDAAPRHVNPSVHGLAWVCVAGIAKAAFGFEVFVVNARLSGLARGLLSTVIGWCSARRGEGLLKSSLSKGHSVVWRVLLDEGSMGTQIRSVQEDSQTGKCDAASIKLQYEPLRHVVTCAMQTGATLVPSISFGEDGAEPFALFPQRRPLAVAVGKPISLPHTSNPAAVLVDDYTAGLLDAQHELRAKYCGLYAAV